ncbi:MAG: hypothetical protein NUW21_09215, partial [Elusimicrobia bacterium]|nr:hypothetical protein [Elusimicrobiota bacterium]
MGLAGDALLIAFFRLFLFSHGSLNPSATRDSMTPESIDCPASTSFASRWKPLRCALRPPRLHGDLRAQRSGFHRLANDVDAGQSIDSGVMESRVA